MIKNIIFDMGQVLLKFDTNEFIKRAGIDNPKDKEIVMREIYNSVEWSMMDRGTLTDEEACDLMKKRVPHHLKDKVKALAYDWPNPIIPIEGIKELLKELKDNGYKIYLLSNASFNQTNYWPNVPGSEYFDGTVVSAYVNLVKPQPEIYKYTLDKFHLRAEESVFIDDKTLNVEGAIYSGLKGIVFHGDINELREKLALLGVKISELRK